MSGWIETTPRCGRLMVGLGTDTYDPTCDRCQGHDGPCMSYDATDPARRLIRGLVGLPVQGEEK